MELLKYILKLVFREIKQQIKETVKEVIRILKREKKDKKDKKKELAEKIIEGLVRKPIEAWIRNHHLNYLLKIMKWIFSPAINTYKKLSASFPVFRVIPFVAIAGLAFFLGHC